MLVCMLDHLILKRVYNVGGKTDEPCTLSYDGQTKNQLKIRLNQHKNDVKAGRNPNGQSAVVPHHVNFGQEPDQENARVLAVEPFWSRRNTRQSLHILSGNTYNLRRDIKKNCCKLLCKCITGETPMINDLSSRY